MVGVVSVAQQPGGGEFLTSIFNDADASESDDTSSSDKKRSRGDFNPGDFSGSMPEGFDPEQFKGKRPGSDNSDNSDNSGSSKRARPDMSNLPDDFDPSQFGSMPDGASRKSRSGKISGKYTVTDEEQELRIPVGTNVTTSSGVKTSFDSIAKGDIIKCSVEKGDDGKYTVKEVWIMEK